MSTNTRRKWRVLIAFALLGLLAGVIAVGWWSSRKPLSNEERHLVGRWTFQLDDTPMSVGLEYEFLPDRTCRLRNIDPKTGAILNESPGHTWWLSGNKLTVRHPMAAAGGFWQLLPSQRSVDEVSVLTPDGPDRFRYTGTIEVRSTPTATPVAGTMTRVTPVE
jgi:hypothetical protein